MSTDAKLKLIEERLLRIEQQLGIGSQPKAPEPAAPAPPPPTSEKKITASETVPMSQVELVPVTVVEQPQQAPPTLAPWQSPLPQRAVHQDHQQSSALATTVMAVGGAISFLLAAAYFIGLIYTTGWLTPARQIGIATVAGIGFIVGGILFSLHERRYSAYLPAVGVTILYLASYAAYAMYSLISFPVMMVSVAIVSLVAIAIDRYFKQIIYSIMATVTVYLTPLLAGAEANLYTTIVYYIAWGMLFSFISLQMKRRVIYLIAMYMAILSFDASWRFAGQPEWMTAFVFQFAQFLIFAGTAAAFSFIHKKGMSEGEAVAHGMPLFFFYITQNFLLHQYAPHWVEIFGLSSVAIVIGLYFFGRNRLEGAAPTSAAALVSSYCSVVVAHVVFFELLPLQLLPWAILAVPIILFAFRSQPELQLSYAVMVPVFLVTAILLASGLALAISPRELFQDPIVGAKFVLLAYSAVLYFGYWLFVKDPRVTNLSPGILYAGHITFLIGVVRLAESQLVISILWAALAVALLVIAIKFGDRVLGHSSLLIFIASAIKVVMFDLAGTPGPIRIGILIVLGISLYAGGWLYQNLVRKTQVFHSNKAINQQLREINTLVQQGLSSQQVHQRLVEAKVPCMAKDGWTVELVDRIRADYHMV